MRFDRSGNGPLFSVLMASYGRPDMVREAVDSVRRQTEKNWELIVVDDASPQPVDLPEDERITLIRNETNRGKPQSLNEALSRAKGDFIGFLDDDDGWGHERLEHALAGHALADIVICGDRVMGAPEIGGSVQGGVTMVTSRERLSRELLAPQGATTISRRLCPSFDPGLRAAEDLDWGIRTAAIPTARVHATDFLWRRHQGARYLNGLDARIECSRVLLSRHRDWYREHPRARSFRWYRLGFMSMQKGDHATGALCALSSLRAYPNPRASKLLILSLAKMLLNTRGGGPAPNEHP